MKKSIITLVGLALCASSAFAGIQSPVFVSGFTIPIGMIQDPTDSTVQFVLQQRGRIKVVQNGAVQANDFLNLVGTVSSSGGERGLLGLAFDPNYATNRFFYVSYTDTNGDSQIVRYTRTLSNPLLADPASAYPIMTLQQPFSNHNGGTINFGPDGYLYLGFGDGGDGNDPGNRAQDITNMLLGKMLRIDIRSDDFQNDNTKNYHIPASNPFVGALGDDEIWDLGMRNPWKWSFDDPTKLGTGALVIADVGQENYEEVDYEPANRGGRNYGWRVYEGFNLTGLSGSTEHSIPFKNPIYAYSHAVGQAITGGYIYRGTQLGDMFGRYFFADYVQSKIFSMPITLAGNGEANVVPDGNVIDHTAELGISPNGISSINVDSEGELYIVGYGGTIFKLAPRNAAWFLNVGGQDGTLLNGGIRNVLSSDSKYLRISPLTAYDAVQANLSITNFGLKSDMAGAPKLDISAETFHNESEGSGVCQFWLRNWTTNQYVLVGAIAPGHTKTTQAVNNVNATNYIRASDGRIDLSVRSYFMQDLDADPYLLYIDKLKVQPHN